MPAVRTGSTSLPLQQEVCIWTTKNHKSDLKNMCMKPFQGMSSAVTLLADYALTYSQQEPFDVSSFAASFAVHAVAVSVCDARFSFKHDVERIIPLLLLLLLRRWWGLWYQLRHGRCIWHRHRLHWHLSIPCSIANRANALHLRVVDWSSITVLPNRCLIHLLLLGVHNCGVYSRDLIILQASQLCLQYTECKVVGGMLVKFKAFCMHRHLQICGEFMPSSNSETVCKCCEHFVSIINCTVISWMRDVTGAGSHLILTISIVRRYPVLCASSKAVAVSASSAKA